MSRRRRSGEDWFTENGSTGPERHPAPWRGRPAASRAGYVPRDPVAGQLSIIDALAEAEVDTDEPRCEQYKA